MTKFWRNEVSTGLILFAFGIALAAVFGHVFHYRTLTNWGDDTDMAINTAICFLLVTTGTLLRNYNPRKPDTKYSKPHE